ncbi:response regulator transcription factor [Clostridium sp. MSJ-8]|uniref:response regulator transcription factor n=1 Tax=Clostridium sp. MSJ-8 TaxID=2841510 RepID=UPI001C0E9B66|nr:response regulator transcription factor [Clostridium sp. MSJ-8]MBU5487984.1 response regulator transcription factor [Clostridium sp. MSJ-8]
MKYKIAVVEDEAPINDILSSALKSEGYNVCSAFLGEEARNILQGGDVDLVLLDVNLPDESGFDLCRFINTKYKIPIIMLTARTDIVDKVLGLELGADDYITKPFHIKEVMTRVKVALRRVSQYKEDIVEDRTINLKNNIRIDFEGRIVYKGEEEVKLKPKEYELLQFLAHNRNKVYSREELLNKVWGYDYYGELRTVDVHVRRLRSKLDDGKNDSIIETVFGTGYVLR